jgi:hypothetical protein
LFRTIGIPQSRPVVGVVEVDLTVVSDERLGAVEATGQNILSVEGLSLRSVLST